MDIVSNSRNRLKMESVEENGENERRGRQNLLVKEDENTTGSGKVVARTRAAREKWKTVINEENRVHYNSTRRVGDESECAAQSCVCVRARMSERARTQSDILSHTSAESAFVCRPFCE